MLVTERSKLLQAAYQKVEGGLQVIFYDERMCSIHLRSIDVPNMQNIIFSLFAAQNNRIVTLIRTGFRYLRINNAVGHKNTYACDEENKICTSIETRIVLIS